MKKIVHIMLAGPVTDHWSYQDNLLTKYHRALGYEVTIITSQWVWNDRGELQKYTRSNYVNENDVKVIRLAIKGWDSFRKKWKRFKNLSVVLERESPDILFIHGCQFMDMNKIVKYVIKNSNIAVYVDNHADFSNSGTNWLSKNILHKILWRYSAQIIEPYTTKFYGVLPARVDFLKNIYGLPAEKCELLVMGADDDKVSEAILPDVRKGIRKQYGIKDDDFLIMTGGKIDSAKRQTLFLMDAVARIQNPKVKLIVFGSVVPDLKQDIESRIIPEKVLYIGWIKSDNCYKHFAAANLVVFPGRHSVFWEQVTGIGIPMICKYWDGTTHVDLGGNVEFLYRNNADEIYEKIIDIINKPEKYRQMKSIAENKGRKMFSYQYIAVKCITM